MHFEFEVYFLLEHIPAQSIAFPVDVEDGVLLADCNSSTSDVKNLDIELPSIVEELLFKHFPLLLVKNSTERPSGCIQHNVVPEIFLLRLEIHFFRVFASFVVIDHLGQSVNYCIKHIEELLDEVFKIPVGTRSATYLRMLVQPLNERLQELLPNLSPQVAGLQAL